MKAKAGRSDPDSAGPGEIDRLHAFEELTDQSMLALAARVERSAEPELMIYRECELDKAWRLLDGALREARMRSGAGETLETVEALCAVVIKAHDLVGVDADVKAAASELRQGVLLARKWVTLKRR